MLKLFGVGEEKEAAGCSRGLGKVKVQEQPDGRLGWAEMKK